MRKRTGMKVKGEEKAEQREGEERSMTQQQRALSAMAKRNKEAKKDNLKQYYFVIYAFCAICVLAVGLSLFSPKKKLADIAAIDESAIMAFNGYQYQFKQQPNSIFEGKTLADIKGLFNNALTDSERQSICKTSKGITEEEDIKVPESYDWREKYPDCVQPILNINTVNNCTASYAYSTVSAAEDRICMKAKETVRLSTQEVLECDVGSQGCTAGFVNRVLMFGQNKGFVPEECHEPQSSLNECEVDHFENNECRLENFVFRIHDYCAAQGDENIKREIVKNGPVTAQMNIHSDFIAYGEGTYHRTPDAMKIQGQHIVKILGWTKALDGSTDWIVENTWGEDWGEKGYGKISSKGDTGIEGMVFGMLISEKTQAELNEARSEPPAPSSPAGNPLGDLMQAGREAQEKEGADEGDDGEEGDGDDAES